MILSFDLMLAAQVFVWLLVAGIFWTSGQASLFHPLTSYWGFHGIVFVVRPLLVYFLKLDSIWTYMNFQPTEADLVKTLMVSSVALVVFAAASLLAGRSNLKFAGSRGEHVTVTEWRALVIVTVLLAPLIAYSIIRANTGGFAGEERGGIYVLTGDSGYTVEAQFMATPLLCVWLVVTRFRWPGLVPLALYVGYRAYWGWMRWTLVLFFISLALAYCWQQRRKWVSVWMVLLAIPLLFLFHALGQRRGLVMAFFKGESISELVSDSAAVTANLPASERVRIKYDTQDFANFDYLTFVLATVPAKTGTYTYGSQYLQLFTEPIPRKLWPGKPLGSPVGFFNLNAYGNFYGLTASLPGDAWMSGGWLGLVITMSFFGGIWGLFHRWFWANNSRCLGAMMYLIALAMSAQQFRDGGISIAKFLFWNLSPLILWAGVSWLISPRLVSVYSTILPRGTRLRLIQDNEARQPESASPLLPAPNSAAAQASAAGRQTGRSFPQ